MNDKKGSQAMGLLGDLVKLDVDKDGKVSGAFYVAMQSLT